MKKLIIFIINIFIIFLIDLFGFVLLMKYGVDSLWSRRFSMAIAFLTTWKPNRLFVFFKLRRRSFVETVRYGIVAFFSSILNYVIYVKLLITFPGIQPLLVVIVSTIPTMIFVFLLYFRLIVKGSYFIKK
ncbi:hypothetical protein CKC_01310 [Candidatus Liberibacter solanacearum CLso-ZC1]|uniref:GtrA/DPMS transmembrane domain-containing protein n=1 Tax=Liberibacter solanacearum (strain CLso-ZC1) TaxID=658172 RepID=E4UCC3_LIBSC|nr:hypothetical protein CKC_01310 [Candidatus Liberibacter solanacearum CLso-ZC1]